MKRYYLKHPSSSGGNEVALAVARAGQTYSIYQDNGIYINACNAECRKSGSDASFWCDGHFNYGNISITKPLGVQSISFYGGCSDPLVSVKYSYTITDTTTGATIASSGGYTSNGTITFPTKYIWSSNVLITATVMKGSGTVTFTASSMSGKTSGTGSGTCSLPAGNILLGAKSISVTATAGKVNIKLYNKYGALLSNRAFSSSNYNYASTAVFDLTEMSDANLTDGAYIIVTMYTSSPVYNSKDVYNTR